jgi:thiol-disulfide isomerase/thioredoxin
MRCPFCRAESDESADIWSQARRARGRTQAKATPRRGREPKRIAFRATGAERGADLRRPGPITTVRDVLLALFCLAALAPIAAARPRLTTVTSSELDRALRPGKGRPLLLHVWASWCVPCRAEWPRLAAYLRQVGVERLDVITVALDEPSQAQAAARILEESGGVPGRCLLAAAEPAGPVLRSLDAEWDGSLPTTLLFDAGGTIRLAQRGLTRLAALEKEVDRVLGAAPRTHDETSKETTTERWKL